MKTGHNNSFFCAPCGAVLCSYSRYSLYSRSSRFGGAYYY